MRVTFAFALLLATTAAAVHAQDRQDRALISYVDSVANAAVSEHRTPGVSVAIVRGGRTILAKGYGYADLENDVPATAETVYRIGSITKQFTAAGIMRLAEQGKLSLDDTLQKFLPAFPSQGNHVTIRELLNHTSGIKSYTSLGPKWQRVMRLDLVPDSLVALFANEPFDFKPGTAWEYDNSGYFLLGMIIEKISGTTYGQFVHDEFFTPLGLKSTIYCYQAPIIKHRAEGYTPAPNGQFVNAAPMSMTQPFAAGSLCSSVTDLAKWTEALAGGKVVSPASYKQMATPLALNDGRPLSYGFGLEVGALRGHRQVYHNGGINGFISELHHYIDDSVVTIVLTNVEGPTATALEKVIATRALGIPDTAAVPLTAAELARYEGTYQVPRLKIRMFADHGRLSSQGEGQPVLHLKHLGGGRFVGVETDAVRLEFPAEGSPAPSVVIRQGGTTMTATRVPSLAGCWKLEAGAFSVVDRVGADPGQTILPSFVRFDTVPGRTWNETTIGRRLRVLADTTATYYRDGYYQFVAPDSVQVVWSTSGMIGMTLELQGDSAAMKGTATAWTDYGGSERAAVALRRAPCPDSR